MARAGIGRPASSPFAMAAVLVGGVLFALLAGFGTAIAGPLGALVFSALIGGAAALLLPARWLVLFLLATSFLVTGQLIFFARIDKALWMPFLVGGVMLVRYPLDRMLHPTRSDGEDAPRTPPLIAGLLLLFFATALASSLINGVRPLQLLVAGKEYLFLWGLYLVLAAGLVPRAWVLRVWSGLPWLMLVQLPVVLYQRFVVVPRRIGMGEAWDSVVGVFGGNPSGGGASGAMGLFCVIGSVTVLARWRRGTMPGWQALVLALSGLVGIALAEVKFAVLLLPIAFGLLFLREFARRPLQALLALVLGTVLAGGVFLAYKFQFGRQDNGETMSEYVTGMFKPSTDMNFVNLRTREIGRLAAIRFWARQHGIDQPSYLLIGHGMGASRIGEQVTGEAAKKWPFNIARSSLALLLWETGLIGTLAYMAMLFVAWLTAFRQSLAPELPPPERATIESMAVAIAVLGLSLPYNTDLMQGHQVQILLILALGFVAMLHGRLVVSTPAPVWAPTQPLPPTGAWAPGPLHEH